MHWHKHLLIAAAVDATLPFSLTPVPDQGFGPFGS